jgi:hypothetical protein
VDTKRLAIGTLVGAITLNVVGYLIWVMLFAEFFAANAGSATGVSRDQRIFWAIALANLAHGTLLSLAIISRARSTTIMEGFKLGAIIGFLVWLGVDFVRYATENVSNLTGAIVDPLLEFVHWGIAGAAVAAVVGKVTASART